MLKNVATTDVDEWRKLTTLTSITTVLWIGKPYPNKSALTITRKPEDQDYTSP